MPELTRRYIVMSMATEGPFDMQDPDAAFVLKPWKDPAALRALEVYRDHAYPELAEDLTAWVTVISSGPVVRGGVGARNEQHMASRSKAKSPARAKPKPRHRVKAVKKVARPKSLKKMGKRRS